MTLDGQERTLTSQMLLIADETKAVALAGVMGGQNSEINLNTVDVLIESACFKPQNIRATSKKLELRTESSYRYERGADIGICDWASQRAAQLILETAGGTLAPGVVDAYPKPFEPKQIALRHTQTDAVLGIAVPMGQQIEYLQRLGLDIDTAAGIAPTTGVRMPHATIFRVPSFRVDLKREIDLIEEVARLYGVDKIPATAPRGAVGSNPYDAVHDQLAEARRILTGLGLFETQGQTLISEAAGKLMAGDALVPLSNPLSSDMNVLRPSLLPGLLDALRHNLSHKTYDVASFEVGRVFTVAPACPPAPAGTSASPTREERRIAIALTGQRNPRSGAAATGTPSSTSTTSRACSKNSWTNSACAGRTTCAARTARRCFWSPPPSTSAGSSLASSGSCFRRWPGNMTCAMPFCWPN